MAKAMAASLLVVPVVGPLKPPLLLSMWFVIQPYHKANTCWVSDVESTKALNAMTITNNADPNWYIDTEASHSMTPVDNDLSGKAPYTDTNHIMVAMALDFLFSSRFYSLISIYWLQTFLQSFLCSVIG